MGLIEGGGSSPAVHDVAKSGYLAALPILAVTAAAASAVMDFAEPLGPITLYGLVGGVAAFVVLFALFALPFLRRLVAAPMMLAALVAVFSGAMWAWNAFGPAKDKDTGALVDQFPALAALQDELGLISEAAQDTADNTAEIADNTGDIADGTRDIADNTTRMADSGDRSADALEDIAEGLEGVRRLGGVIDAPETVSDFINNAVVYEERGDALNARRMYEGAIARGAPYVDIHDRYVAMLKAQEGLLGARDVYAQIAVDQRDNPAAQLAAATLAPRDDVGPMLATLATQFPDFGPVYMAQFEQYDLLSLANWTLVQRAEAGELLGRYLEAYERGRVERWYVNRDFAEAKRLMAEAYVSSFDQLSAASAPITLSIWYSYYDWVAYLGFAEQVKDVEVRRPGSTEFGPVEIDGLEEFSRSANFQVDGDVRRAMFAVRYTNADGEVQGPFEVDFDIDAFFGERSQRSARSSRDSWVSQDANGDGTAELVMDLLGEHCGIRELRYGVNTETPDTVFPIPECTMTTFHDFPDTSADEDSVLLETPANTVSMQVEFTNGTTSPVRVFNVTLDDET